MTMNESMFSSESSEWETPPELFNSLDKVFKFTLDPCASKKNAKCNKYFTKKDNGLKQSWKKEAVFMNPPYGREVDKWVEKAFKEYEGGAKFIVMLIAARTETKRWQKTIFPKSAAVCFLNRRVKFLLNGKEHGSPAFPSAVVVFKKSGLSWKQKKCLWDLGFVIDFNLL